MIFYCCEAYLKEHEDRIDDYAITKDDCAFVFRTGPFDGADVVMREKWKLVGQCLARVCSKRCSWSKLEVRAASPSVCKMTQVAEEAIVYWLFVSEGNGWVHGFLGEEYNSDSESDDQKTFSETTSAGNTNGKKKNGQHKTVKYLYHYRQLCGLITKHRENSVISEQWDNAWMTFASEELELKKNREGVKKRKLKDVLPKFKDVLGVGKTAADSYSSYGLVIDESILLCTQKEEV